MRTFKRKFIPIPIEHRTKLWRRYTEKELLSNNLSYLLHFSENTRNMLLNLTVLKSSINNVYYTIIFEDTLFEKHPFALQKTRKSKVLHTHLIPREYEMTKEELFAIKKIFNEVPLEMICYFGIHCTKMNAKERKELL